MQSRAVVFESVGRASVIDIETPPPGPGELGIRVESSVISPGTELRCLFGTQPNLPDPPFVPGYAAAGVVVEAEPGLTGWLGRRVFFRGTSKASVALSWGGHVGHAVTSVDSVIEIPDGVNTVASPLARLFGIANRGLALTQPRANQTVGVVGLGIIGQCSARLFHAAGCRVIGVDNIPARVESLRGVGVEAVVVGELASEALLSACPDGVDILVDATGSEKVLNEAVAATKSKAWGDATSPSPQVVIQGSYPTTFEVDYHTFFRKEATVHFPRDTTAADTIAVLDLMASHQLEYSDLLTWVGPPEDAQEIYSRLADREPGLLTGAFVWE